MSARVRWWALALAWAAMGLLFVGLVGWMLFGWLQEFVVFRTFDYVVNAIVIPTKASPHLVKGIVVLLIGPFFLALRDVGRLPLFRAKQVMPPKVAWPVIVGYLGVFFLTLHFVSRRTMFVNDASGRRIAMKYYAVVDGRCEFFDVPGSHPEYGMPLVEVSPEAILFCKRVEKGQLVQSIPVTCPASVVFFDPVTAAPTVWYRRGPAGELELFASAGFHPRDGRPLVPVDASVVEELSRECAARERARIEEAAKRTADEQRRAGEQAAHAREADARAQASARDDLLTALLPDRSPNSSEMLDVAVGVVDETGAWDSRTAQAICALVARDRVEIRPRVLGRAFASPAHFTSAFDGEPLRDVDLSDRADLLLLVRKTTAFSQDRRLANIVTARTSFEARLVRARDWRVQGRISDTQSGAGAGRAAAEEQAVERLTERIGTLF
ncbi:MAG: hypothetical protein ABW221_11160 [Vicinamibacteria bacterium]